MVKIGNLKIELAKPTAPETGVEIGTSANGSLPSILGEEFIDTSKVKVKDFKKMLDNDGTVQALYNTIVMPILGSNWTIEPEDDSPEAVKQSEEVEADLRTPPHKDGMSTPFDLVLAQALRAVVEGYAGFEKVYAVKNGRITFKKVAWRDPTTITMRTDDRGGFYGLRQRAFIGNEYKDVVIPLERSFVYTYGKEFHNLKGRSAFTSAYVSYDKKRRLYYFAEQQAQSDALKTKVVKVREGAKVKQDELDATVEAVDELGFKATVGLPASYDLDTLDTSGRLDLMPLIEHHNAEMARSVLAMFILLGTGSKTGSYSLSQDQSDFFIQALMSIRRSLENHITSYLIPDLYKYNYASPRFGTFKFEDITDSTIDLLKQVFIKLTEKDRLPKEVIDGVVQKVADKLDIDVNLLSDAIGDEEDDSEETPPVENSRRPKLLSTDGWRRELTPAEKRVNFTGIEKKLNTLEAEYERAIKPIYDELVAGAKVKLNSLLEDKKYKDITEKALFDENLKNQYTRTIKESGLEAYIYGKNGASDELEVKAPPTPKESKDFFRDNAVSVADKQFADLTFKITSEVSKARRKDQLAKFSIGDVIASVNTLFEDYYKEVIGITAAAIVAIGINRGRKDVFDKNSSDIEEYQYSAILDVKTCPICDDLDGSVVVESEYLNTTFDPPVHHHCRCIWVAILKDELDPPAVTGLPASPGGVTEPSLSKENEKLKDKVDFLFDALADDITKKEFSSED